VRGPLPGRVSATAANTSPLSIRSIFHNPNPCRGS
jgi:hypothetical protein